MSGIRRTLAFSLIVSLLLVAAPLALAQDVMPSVVVNDQEIQNGTVTVASVVSDGPGWIVIHADDNGAPGAVIGHAAVTDGENTDVVVEIDEAAATETLYAMLHTDAGQVGTYEFPGDDVPVQVDGQVVTPAFSVGMEAPEALPATGGAFTPWMSILLVVGGIALLITGGLVLRRHWATQSV
jgi:hypothetical protein